MDFNSGFPSISASDVAGGRKRKRPVSEVPDDTSNTGPVFASDAPTKGGRKKSGGFQALGLSQAVLSGILRMGYQQPTPVQRKTLPVALTG
jgi:hypothetical protein